LAVNQRLCPGDEMLLDQQLDDETPLDRQPVDETLPDLPPDVASGPASNPNLLHHLPRVRGQPLRHRGPGLPPQRIAVTDVLLCE